MTCVVATGGGAVTDPANMEHLRAKSVCVLLTSDIGTIRKRLEKSPRPPLTSLPRKKRLRRYCPAGAGSTPHRQTSAWTRARHPQKKRQTGSLPFSNRARSPPQVQEAAFRWFAADALEAPELHRLETLLTGPDRDVQTRFLGIAGYPCSHSKSPLLFNRLFERYNLNCHYTRFENPSIATILQVARDIDAKGLSVTIPFKRDVMAYLDEIDDDAAQQIGAVNTVVFTCGAARATTRTGWAYKNPLPATKAPVRCCSAPGASPRRLPTRSRTWEWRSRS